MIPIRGAASRPPAARARGTQLERRRGRAEAPSCSRVTPSAWQSRPGPEQSSRSSATPRRAAHLVEPARRLERADEHRARRRPRPRRRGSGTSGCRRSGRRTRGPAGRTSRALRGGAAAEAVRGRVVRGRRPRPRRSSPPTPSTYSSDADQLRRDLVHAPGEEVGSERRSPAGQSARRRLRRGSPAPVGRSTRAAGGRGGRGRRRRTGPARPRRRRAGRDRARRRGSRFASAAGFAPIAATIARSVREATIGSAIPSTQTRVRAPCPRSPVGRAARARRSCRRGRTCRSPRKIIRGAPSATAGDYPRTAGRQIGQASAVRSASTTRS